MTSERIKPGAEAAHRDDLARDVARLWLEFANYRGSTARWDQLESALRRLAAAYDVNAREEKPRVDHRPRKRSACCDEALDEHGHCMYCDV